MSHRLSYENFARFAPHMGEALRHLPRTTIVTPSKMRLSEETYAARFRDARLAKNQYNYIHPAIDPQLYKTHSHNLSVRMLGNDRVEIYDRTIKSAPPSPEQHNDHIEFNGSENDTLLLAHWLARRLFNPALSFSVSIPPESELHERLSKMDVELVKDGDHYILM
jgi:hypothetical protein